MTPSAEASATAEPETPPKMVEPTTVTCPKPPGKRPTSRAAKSINRRPRVPRVISTPDKMKKGMASIGKLCVGWNSFTTAMTEGTSPKVATATPEAMINAYPTGKDTAKSSAKRPIMSGVMAFPALGSSL